MNGKWKIWEMGKTVFTLLLAVATLVGQDSNSSAKSDFVEVDRYDPSRAAAKDLADAEAEAQKTGKNVFVEFGGDWCVWCHIMDRTFTDNPDLLKLREDNYILVKINVSRENENKEVLQRFKGIEGFPWIVILDADGKVLKSKDSAELESGKGYDLKRFRSFLKKYAPKH